MKTAKWMSVALMGTLAALASACAVDEEMGDNATGGSGKLMTIMVGTESGSNTRVSYSEGQDDTPSLTWELNDKLAVVGHNTDGAFKGKKDYLLDEADHGETIGAFTGEEIAEAEIYNVYYPHSVVNELGIPGFTIGEQIQVGDNSTAHLKNNIFLQSADVTDLGNITLSMRSSILKFALSGIPKEVGTLKELRWVVETASGEKTLKLAFSTASANKIQFSATKSDLTAYLAFMPEDMAIKQGGKFRVELIGDKIYMAEKTVDAGKTYVAGHRYTALIDGQAGTMEWKLKMITLSTGTPIYDGLPIQIGYIRNDYTQASIQVADLIVQDSKVSFEASLLPYPEAHSTVWFCIPEVVKFIYTPGSEGLGHELTLPDKNQGSTLHENPKVGGKSYMNEWIVALYMGIEGSLNYNQTPLYWATGNVIASKVNNDAYLHIATAEETLLEAGEDGYYVPDGLKIAENGYEDCAEGAQWNLFNWYPSPINTITGDDYFDLGVNDISGGYNDFVVSYMKNGLRIPLGAENLSNVDRELSLLMGEGLVSGLASEFWEVDDKTVGYKYTYVATNNIENTLTFPLTGKAFGNSPERLGELGYYWSGTAYYDDYLHSYYYIFSNEVPPQCDVSARSWRHAIRPVTE